MSARGYYNEDNNENQDRKFGGRQDNEDGERGLSTGAKVAIGAGVAALIGGGAYAYKKHHDKEEEEEKQQQQQHQQQQSGSYQTQQQSSSGSSSGSRPSHEEVQRKQLELNQQRADIDSQIAREPHRAAELRQKQMEITEEMQRLVNGDFSGWAFKSGNPPSSSSSSQSQHTQSYDQKVEQNQNQEGNDEWSTGKKVAVGLGATAAIGVAAAVGKHFYDKRQEGKRGNDDDE
ncbi:hypothetical protein GQ42DRAFT_165260 [Ramicandelaber brevisporus]|nr:hypothetical protein GQ42DRAFT_165260 [Ramicandelaber brevisporus]